MATGISTATRQPQILAAWPSLDRLFYVIAASAILFFTFVGFNKFYLHGKTFTGAEITRQIAPVVIAHGLAMSGWVILLLAQSMLIAAGNRRLHMRLGVLGAVLAAVIVILGMFVATLSVHFNSEAYKPFGGARFFLGIMLTEMLSPTTSERLGNDGLDLKRRIGRYCE